jgi:mannose-1-phosphate guanylyltransferase
MGARNGYVTRAAVLCGGEGSRLKPLTNYFQKTMIPIGPRMRPALEYGIRQIMMGGISGITLLTGYKGEEVESYFEDGAKLGAKITYSRDAADRHGSAHALMNAIERHKVDNFDHLLVYYADVISTLDVKALIHEHKRAKADATLVLSKNYHVPVGVATVKGERVVEFREKPAFDHPVTMGTLVISSSTLPILRDVTGVNENRDIMTHFVSRLIRELRVVPYYQEGSWFDIGTSEALERRHPREIEEHLRLLDTRYPEQPRARLVGR